MAAPSDSRFTSQGKTTTQRLSTNTVGLVALSDYRKRRADVLEQQEKDARNAIATGSGTATPDRSQTATPNRASDLSEAEHLATNKKKKKRTKKVGGNKLSFGLDEDSGEEHADTDAMQKKPKPGLVTKTVKGGIAENSSDEGSGNITANAAVKIAPRVQTKASLRKEAAEREVLRREFLVLQTAVKATEIAIPFVFYDGSNIPGGTVRVKKGDFIWVFLDKSRKVGADLGVGGDKISNVRREWARVSVDDLMLVRGNIIIPHHYDFYFFIINKSLGPGRKRLFDYSAESSSLSSRGDGQNHAPETASGGLHAGGPKSEVTVDVRRLEGAGDDPSFTKVVDRRWYERNKHIFPASAWQEFDPEKNYDSEIRRDVGGNAFFFSR